MPIASIMSARTGQAFDVEFSAPPTEEDIDEATSAWETQFYQREGLDPSIAEQGVLGTAGNAFARDLGGVALDTVGGVAKGAAETKRALGPAGEVLRLMPGMSTVMSLGGAGDAVAGFTDAVRERGREVYPTNPANPVADTIGGGAGQAVAMLGTMGAAAPVMGTGAALTVVPSVLGGTMGLGSGIDTAKDMGIDNPAGRLALGAAFGGAEAITERLGGIGGKAAAKALQQGVRAGLKQAGKSVLSEAIEEPISGTLQDAATFTAGQFVADPNRPGYTTNGTKLPALDAEFLKRRKLEAIGGAAGGVVFGGLQMVGTQAGRGEEGKRGAGEPGPPPLPVREDLGELTAEDVADLEGATVQDSSTVPARAPILTNVPDRVEPTADAPVLSAAESSGPVPVQDSGTVVPVVGEAQAAPLVPQVGDVVSYEGYDGRLQQDGQRLVVEVPNGPVVEVADPAGVQPAAYDRAAQVRMAELQTMPDPQVSETQFSPAGDGTLSLKDSSGNTYVPHNDQLLRSVRTNEAGGIEVLLRNPKRPGQVIKLTGKQAEQAQEAILSAAINVEDQGGKVRYGTGQGFQNLQSGKRSNAGSTTLPVEAIDALVNMAQSAVRAGKKFTAWSAEMVKRFGETIREYLAHVWAVAKDSLPTTAAQNVRLGSAAKGGPVRLQRSGALDMGASMPAMASTSGAAQSNEPSPGGLSEAQLNQSIFDKLPDLPTGTVALVKVTGLGKSGGNRVIRHPSGGLIAIVANSSIRWGSWDRTKFRQFAEAAWPFEKNVFVRVSNNADDYSHIKNRTHRGSRNHRDGIDEGGISVAHSLEHPAKYAYLVTGEVVGEGTDGEPLLDTNTVSIVGSSKIYGTTQAKIAEAQKSKGIDPDLFFKLASAKPIATIEIESAEFSPSLTQPGAQSGTLAKGFKNLEPGGKTAGFVNGQILAEAEALIRDGFTDFANWSRAMVTRFGQAIREFLQGIWEQVSAALPNDAAKNVRLGSSAKAASVGLAQGGFVMGPNRVEETKARFARPEQQERLYQVREDVTVKAAAEAWVDSLPMAEAVAAMEAGRLPADMTGDVAQHAAGLLIQRTTEMMKSGSEVVQMQARSLGHRISKVWQGWLSQEAGRNLRQRSVVSAELTPYAPILAAEGMLIDRADAVMGKRYDGGAEGAATKVNETAAKAGGEASTELVQDMEADTPVPGESSVAREMREARKARALKNHPSLKRLLDALRKKLYPGMKWADIFMDLPASQKERQREIYRRLMLDERLKGLSKDERLSLTNELDKAWQQERRKVFLRELERVGIGEKAAADKAKVVKALPKLIRLINLGMMNSEMFREAIAPEYGLKQITTGQALALRKLAEEAYALPEGVLRSRKLAALLDGIQKSTGTGLPEVLNQYWVAAVLSGMRTQFDTFMSVSNGFGNQLIQSGMLAIKNGNRAAAMVSMLEWWRGLKQAFPEAMQILSKGDYSYLKRFNDDLRKALEGETTFRPVPLGEALWRDGNAMEKYGFAPVMIWTGRLMAAADHLNNSATTAGAKVVARALHPELYKTVAASPSEREAAAVQARREVTGGAMPATAQDRATVAARTREILNGQLRPEEVKEAAFMGDQAAYQNDPTGVFGGIYRAVNQGLGTLERGLQAYAEERGADGPAGRYARGMMLFFSGAMRSMMGAKFIRFGANFGNDMLGYVPGTVLVSPALLGTEATRSQRQLLMGKNVFGLMAGLTVAAMFLGKDDEEEGWHMEGPWSDLTPEEVKQRRAAGFESLTFWKRTADKVERVSYKQWPTAGLLAGVAHMQDRQRFRPEKWAKEGMAGHLLAAATVGAFQVKDVSAMRGLADLLGASKFGANPEDALVEKMAKMPVNFAGGFIPTLVKDLDALADSRRYKPETVMEEFLRNVPLARRAVAGGRPEINILGVAIEQDRKPWSRAYTDAESGPAHAVLGSLSARGFTLPTPETNRKVWKDGAWSTIAAMGADAEWRYQKKVGDGYRAWLGSSEGRALLTMPDGLAVQKLINRQADTIKRQALQAVMK